MASISVEAFPTFDNSHFECTQSIDHNSTDQSTTKKCDENEQKAIRRPDTPKRQSTDKYELEIELKEIVRQDAPSAQSVQPFAMDVERGSIAPVTQFARLRKRMDPILMWVPGTTEWRNPRHLINGMHPDRVHGRRAGHHIFADNFSPSMVQGTPPGDCLFLRWQFYGFLALIIVAGILLIISRLKH